MTKEKKKEFKKNPSSLRFSPYAWAKLIYMRDRGKTEVGGYGICPADDLLYVEDIVFPEQDAAYAFIELEKGAVSKHMEDMFVKHDYQPNQCTRIWIHTHPGNSATPSSYDDDIFQEKFGHQDWSVAFILARGGDCTCRLQINTDSLKYESQLAVEIDWASEFWGSDHELWEEEYENVTETVYVSKVKGKTATTSQTSSWIGGYADMADEYYQRDYIDNPYASGYGEFAELEDTEVNDFPENPKPNTVHEDEYGNEWVYIDDVWTWELLETIIDTIDEDDKDQLIRKAQ